MRGESLCRCMNQEKIIWRPSWCSMSRRATSGPSTWPAPGLLQAICESGYVYPALQRVYHHGTGRPHPAYRGGKDGRQESVYERHRFLTKWLIQPGRDAGGGGRGRLPHRARHQPGDLRLPETARGGRGELTLRTEKVTAADRVPACRVSPCCRGKSLL